MTKSILSRYLIPTAFGVALSLAAAFIQESPVHSHRAAPASGKDPVLLRLAQGIIVEQLQEIDVMRRQLKSSAAICLSQPETP